MNRLPHVVDLGFDALDILARIIDRDEGIFAVLALDEIDAESGDAIFRGDAGRIEVGEDFVKEELSEILAIGTGGISFYFVERFRTTGFVIDEIDFVRIGLDMLDFIDFPGNRHLVIEEDIARSEIVLEFGGEVEMVRMERVPSTESDESFLAKPIHLLGREDLTRERPREGVLEEREWWNLRCFFVLKIEHLERLVVHFPENRKLIILEWVAENCVSEESLGIIEEGIEIGWRDAIGLEEFLDVEPFFLLKCIDSDRTFGFIEDKSMEIHRLGNRTVRERELFEEDRLDARLALGFLGE